MLEPSDPLSEEQLKFNDLHEKGHVAFHAVPQIELFFEKIDDRRILTNLREDGGTTERSLAEYQLFTVVSATVLPPARYSIRQELYIKGGERLLIGLDMEKSIIKEFSRMDTSAGYSINKKGRVTYKGRGPDYSFTSKNSNESRLSVVDHFNELSSEIVSNPGEDLFGDSVPPVNYRSINEIILKINNNSMINISAQASDLINYPDVLLNLLYTQYLVRLYSGKTYPIFVYNNSKEDISLDLIDPSLKKVGPNQFCELNAEKVLEQLYKRFPEKIPISIYRSKFLSLEDQHQLLHDPGLDLKNIDYNINDFFQLIGHDPLDSYQSKNEFENKESEQRLLRIEQIESIAPELSNMLLPPDDKEYNITQIHKQFGATEEEKYEKLNQRHLACFIKEKLLGLDRAENMSKEEAENFKILMKAYNVLFRIEIYYDLLQSGSPVNYHNLDKDIKWLVDIKNKLQKIAPEKSSAPATPPEPLHIEKRSKSFGDLQKWAADMSSVTRPKVVTFSDKAQGESRLMNSSDKKSSNSMAQSDKNKPRPSGI